MRYVREPVGHDGQVCDWFWEYVEALDNEDRMVRSFRRFHNSSA